MSSPIPRENIPLPIQREVRQRCGFGCVICGLPLYEYEHLLGYANVKRHVAEEMTLLCDQHHREKTAGLLPVEVVKAADENPYNLREGTSKPYNLHYSGDECEVIIGSNRFTTKDQGYGTILNAICVDDVPLLGFILAEGQLLLTVNLFDDYNHFALRIVNNQLVYSVSPWDIQLVGRNLVIKEAQRKIFVDITFEVPNRIIVNRGRMLCNGVEILIRPEHILITNNPILISGGTATNYTAGLVIGQNYTNQQGFTYIGDIPRYLGDRTESIKWAKEILKIS